MSRMHNPPHPGAVLQDTVLRADGGITVTEFAERLKVSARRVVARGEWTCRDQRRACDQAGRRAGWLC